MIWRKLIPLLILVFVFPIISVERSGRDEIFEKHVWKQIYDEYLFDPGIIEILKAKTTSFFCKSLFCILVRDSENNVPPFMRILDEIGVEGTQVNYFHVDRKQPGEKYYFEKLNVERSSLLFFKDGKEIGRIVENPKKKLEEDLLEILF